MPTFSSVYPYDVKLKNHSFGNDDVSLLYITNKINETSSFQKLKVSVLQQALGEYTFNSFDFKAPTTIDSYVPATNINTQTLAPANSVFKPDSSQYNLGMVIKEGVLEEKVLLSFSNILYTALQKSLPSGTDVAVQGPFISSSNNTLTWYCAFSQNIVTSKSSTWKAVPSNIAMVNISKTADGKLFAIGTDHNFYTCDLKASTTWTKIATRGWQACSGIATSDGCIWLIGLDHNLYYGGKDINAQYKLMPGCGDTTFLAGMADNSLLGINTSGDLLHMPIGVTTWQTIDQTTPLKSLFMGANNVIYGVGKDGITYQRSSLQGAWNKLTTIPSIINYQKNVAGTQYGVNNENNTLVHATIEDDNSCLNFELDGVSAAPESGSRNTQIEFLFGAVSIGTNTEKFTFKRLVSLDILNHQGQSYAPLQFGVVGDGELLINGGPQKLNLYFKTFQNQPLTFNANTIITFTFPDTESNTELVAFGSSADVTAYTLTSDANAHFDATKNTAGVIKAKYTKATLATPLELNFDIFKFSEIQLSKSNGLAIIEVTVENLPGYWDSTFQIPINKTTKSIDGQLELPASSNKGRSGGNGSRIDFTSEHKDKNQHYNLTIEASNGLNLYGMPYVPKKNGAQGVHSTKTIPQPGLPIRIKEADLLIPDGRLAINNGGEHYPAPESGDHNINENEKLNVKGDTYLEGHLGMSGHVAVGGVATVTGDTSLEGAVTIAGATDLKGAVTIAGATDLEGGVTIAGITTINSQIELGRASDNGNYGPGSRIDFLSSGKSTNGIANASIEENCGLNLHGTATQPVKVRNADLEVSEGSATISKSLTVTENINANGNVTVKGATSLIGNTTINGITTLTQGATVNGTTTVNGTLNVNGGWTTIGAYNCGGIIPEGSTSTKGVSVGWNGSGGYMETNFYNLKTNAPRSFQFSQVTANNTKTDLMTIDSNGHVGIGTTSPSVPLHVNLDIALATPDKFGYLNSGGITNQNPTAQSPKTSIKAEGTIQADQFYAVSDQRIKTALKPSVSGNDLTKLLSINITDYQYVDKIKQGNKTTKGVIAQELESIFPYAINRSTDFIPNIYAAANSIKVSEAKKELTCTLDKKHELVVGDLVKLITESNTELQKEVSEIVDEKTFLVKDWSEKEENIFIFGKQVDDFRTVDYQQVSMLGISAIQALYQDVKSLKKENQSLKEQLQGEMKSLRAEVEQLKKVTS